MLSENVASNSLQVTVEGIKVAGKLSEETLKMLKNLLKSTGHLAIGSVKLGVAVGDKVKKNNLLNRSGEQTLLKFIKENEPLNDTIVLDAKDMKLWQLYANKLKLDYVPLQNSLDSNQYKIIIKERKLLLAQEVLSQTLRDKASQKTQENFDLTKDELNSVIQGEHFVNQEGNIEFKRDFDNSERWDSLWKNSKFYNEDINNNIGTKKENFISNLEDGIEHSIGLTNDNYTVIPDRGIVYLDHNNLTFINFNNASISTEEIEDVEKWKDGIKKNNEKYNFTEMQLNNKYKDYSESQKRILKIAMNEGYDVSKLDNIEFSPSKMSAILYCMEDKINVNKVLMQNYNHEQIHSLRKASIDGINTELIEDVNLNYEQMDKIINEIKRAKRECREPDIELINAIKNKTMIDEVLDKTIIDKATTESTFDLKEALKNLDKKLFEEEVTDNINETIIDTKVIENDEIRIDRRNKLDGNLEVDIDSIDRSNTYERVGSKSESGRTSLSETINSIKNRDEFGTIKTTDIKNINKTISKNATNLGGDR